jgi:transcription initiation factor TFIID subunit 13
MEYSRKRKRANLFSNDLKSLMYAFGDVPNPHPESVAVLEDILQDYIVSICHEAYRMAVTANRQKIKVDDFKFAIRNDHKKLGRVDELLHLQREIAEARKTFDNSEGKSLSKAYNEKKEKEEAAGKDGKGKKKDKEKKERKKRKKAGQETQDQDRDQTDRTTTDLEIND